MRRTGFLVAIAIISSAIALLVSMSRPGTSSRGRPPATSTAASLSAGVIINSVKLAQIERDFQRCIDQNWLSEQEARKFVLCYGRNFWPVAVAMVRKKGNTMPDPWRPANMLLGYDDPAVHGLFVEMGRRNTNVAFNEVLLHFHACMPSLAGEVRQYALELSHANVREGPRFGRWVEAVSILGWWGDQCDRELLCQTLPKATPFLAQSGPYFEVGADASQMVPARRIQMSLARLGDADARREIRAALESPDLDARVWGCLAAEFVGGADWYPLLMALLSDERPWAVVGRDGDGRYESLGLLAAQVINRIGNQPAWSFPIGWSGPWPMVARFISNSRTDTGHWVEQGPPQIWGAKVPEKVPRGKYIMVLSAAQRQEVSNWVQQRGAQSR